MLRAAKALPGFAEDGPEKTLTVGFARDAVLGVADTIIDAVKSGAISHFFLIGGCDGAAPGRNYFSDVATLAPADTVLLTLGCGKYRISDREYGDDRRHPAAARRRPVQRRLLRHQVAAALADAFGCEVNDLPLTLRVLVRAEGVAVLLTLLALGIRKIHLGPTLPAFLTPTLVEVLGSRFGLALGTDAEADVAAAVRA